MLVDMYKIDVFSDDKGTKIKYRKRCELCKFVKIDLITDELVCEKKLYEFVKDDNLCEDFKLDSQLRQDMIDKVMECK